MLLGIHLISPLQGDWDAQRALIQRGKFTVGKVLIQGSAAWAPENVEQLLTVLAPGPNGRKTIILRTEDALTPWSALQHNALEELRFEYSERGFQELVAKRPDVDWYLEVLNEPNMSGLSVAQTSALLRNAIQQKADFGPDLSWIASLPTNYREATVLLESGATAEYDVLGCHLYGDYHLGDGSYDWAKILAACLDTNRGVWITEAGINDSQTNAATKALRVLEWMGKQTHPRLVGLVVFVEGIGTQWPQYEIDQAAADVYGQRVIKSPPIAVTPAQGGTMNYGGISNLVDLRSQLRTNPHGGPQQRVALASKTGLVVHYNGPPVEQSALNQLKADASYHCQEVWGRDTQGRPLYGDGIMYHLGIGEDGTAYLLRDFESVLWHCAAWPQNATALSVTLPIGDGQHATQAALTTLKRVCDEWQAAGHGSQVWGHQELSPTSCPGTLMADFVYPYRAGTIVLNTKQEGAAPVATYVKFRETGHGVGGGFLNYFTDNGGVRIFGFPISEEMDGLTEDGDPVRVQYFERARFEWHPGADPSNYDVMLTRLGALAFTQQLKIG